MVVHSAAERVLAGLDPEQRSAVTAPAGPVCILAGAGTGKTRAVTSRIAHRALAGDISARHVLAVTFTARAAAEMRSRLAGLGVPGVQARTFHAAALRQVRYFAPRLLEGRAMPELLESKVRLVTLAAAKVGLRADRAAARDLAGEIEWAKSSLVEPAEYVVAAAKALRDTPHEPAKVAEVFAAYEKIKRGNGVIDFEDMLRAAVWGIEEHPDVAEQVRGQYRHFVVDEYQDVNPLQQRLLEAWLGGRDDLTVVGDASQTIYSFTGATSSYLVDFPRRHRGATVVRLVRDYRSTPQVVGLANAVISQARGAEARLRLELVGQRPPGPEPELRIFTDEPAEASAVAARCRALVDGGTPAREIAVLFRTNAQSEAYEKALTEAEVPYLVQGAERFFERPEVRQAMVALRAATRSIDGSRSGRGARRAELELSQGETPLRAAVVEALSAVGWAPDAAPAGGAARERWEALAALVQLAEEYAATPPASARSELASPAVASEGPALPLPIGSAAAVERLVTLTDFNDELARRAVQQHVPTVDGVTLASLHSAKGLEWDAVFLVGLAEGTLPTSYAKTPEQVEEERRLLYVGVTRAREWLWLSYAAARSPGGRARRPSRFLPQLDRSGGTERAGAARRTERRRTQVVSCRICGATLLAGADRKLGRCPTCPSDIDLELYERLREWRQRVAGAQKVPAYVIFTDATLTALAERKPGRPEELIAIAGIGPRKLGLYGDTVLALVGGAAVDAVCPEKTFEIEP
ncbi:ATP-dependent DNA helicase, Rep family [Micromonospora rhizosphaerae]|uniref:DNA 3'-5' helicase n=1 Tax=Micromonospora rhizosphaerae TaxID=568872 RepID=A0A1C6TDW9_9ACTN|nr:ATP-dependent DNA helicase UvrD2 [Micromonospora rhizosphaerae]SCL39742.1 ATP-dependent DNA helicase, Rep family [Micromonospora rhizosphaerae]